MLFGEHAREMISPETGLAFVEKLCEGQKSNQEMVIKTLEKFRFQIVVNANPSSRKKVENGDYCLRVNENGLLFALLFNKNC